MKKYLLVFLALLLTAAVVTAAVLDTGKKPTNIKKEKKGCSYYKKTHASRTSNVACY
jgi:hypothetical protein